MSPTPRALDGITVLERGWLSSNNVLIHAAPGEPGAVLVDTSHVNHAAQTVALVRRALAGAPLARIVNTHLHSDHCGGNASLQRAFGAPVFIPPGSADAVRAWDEARLSYAATGQRCERFEVAGTLAPGASFSAGGRRWDVLAAPGHDPDSVMLFDAAHGVLISADALWESGFGVVFPEVVGEPGFDDVGRMLDLIERLPVSVVIPGHGAPFTDVAAAIAQARRRLAGFQADPPRPACGEGAAEVPPDGRAGDAAGRAARLGGRHAAAELAVDALRPGGECVTGRLGRDRCARTGHGRRVDHKRRRGRRRLKRAQLGAGGTSMPVRSAKKAWRAGSRCSINRTSKPIWSTYSVPTIT